MLLSVEVLVVLALRWGEPLVVVGGVVALAEEALRAAQQGSILARYDSALHHVCHLL